MKYLKKYKNFEAVGISDYLANLPKDEQLEFVQTIKDILLELEDKGFGVSVEHPFGEENWENLKNPWIRVHVYRNPGFLFTNIEDIFTRISDFVKGYGLIWEPQNSEEKKWNRPTIIGRYVRPNLNDLIDSQRFECDMYFTDPKNSVSGYEEKNEKYKYVGIMDFSDDQIKKLDEIEKTFNQIPKEDLEECIIDLENIGYNYTKNALVSILWRDRNLNTGKAHTSFGESFTFYTTRDFYNKSSVENNIFDHQDFKVLNCELIQSIYNVKSESEIDMLFANDAIKSHFYNSILKEIEQFDNYIKDGFIPCVVISRLSFLKNWTLDPKKVDVIFELKERISELCGYDIVFAPSIDTPSIIFVDKKYIHRV